MDPMKFVLVTPVEVHGPFDTEDSAWAYARWLFMDEFKLRVQNNILWVTQLRVPVVPLTGPIY